MEFIKRLSGEYIYGDIGNYLKAIDKLLKFFVLLGENAGNLSLLTAKDKELFARVLPKLEREKGSQAIIDSLPILKNLSAAKSQEMTPISTAEWKKSIHNVSFKFT